MKRILDFATDQRELDALRELGSQLLETARSPDAPHATSPHPANQDAGAEARARSFAPEDETGGTLYQMFTELDSTQTNASALAD